MYSQTDQKWNKIPKATLSGPEIRVSCTGNIYVRHMNFWKKGIVELGHRHPYSHTSLLASGSIRVQVYDEQQKCLLPPKDFTAPAMIFVEKNLAHQLTSLEDNTVVCCIHALRDEDHEIIDPESFPVNASLTEALVRYQKLTGKNLESPNTQFDELTPLRVPRLFNGDDKF